MSRMPLVMWLVIHAAEAVGWRVDWSLTSPAVVVTEDGPNLTHRPRRWRLTAEELPRET